ncbi:MAG: UTP--glucose-1-phosphate uridylyltransferase, partial [Ruoffia tabacinasalis]
ARAFVNDEPFVVMLGDNIMHSEVPVTKQLMDLYDKNRSANLAVVEVPDELTSKYGMIKVDRQDDKDDTVYSVSRFVEKPAAEEAPSNLAIAGRYILTPEIFDILEKIAPGVDDELQLTDAIDQLNKTQRVFAKKVEGKRYDVGNKIGYMKMSLEYGLEHPETAEEFSEYIIQLSDKLEAEDSNE